MAGRAIEVRIAPLHHSLPNAGDAAMSQKHPSDLPGWSRAATVEKIQPRTRAPGSSSAPRGAAPHGGGGAVGRWSRCCLRGWGRAFSSCLAPAPRHVLRGTLVAGGAEARVPLRPAPACWVLTMLGCQPSADNELAPLHRAWAPSPGGGSGFPWPHGYAGTPGQTPAPHGHHWGVWQHLCLHGRNLGVLL